MNNQRGAALLVGLLLLLVLTILAVTSVNLSTINLRIVGNMQATQLAESAVEQAIETALLDPANFAANKDTAVTLGNVTVKPRRCLYSEFIGDTSAGVTPGEIAIWEVGAVYVDPITNAQTEVVRGVKIVMEGNGNCLP